MNLSNVFLVQLPNLSFIIIIIIIITIIVVVVVVVQV